MAINPPKQPHFFETTSPFETYRPGGKQARTWKGKVDKTAGPPAKLVGRDFQLTSDQIQPEQYDNPRGYPGLSMVHMGDQKSRFPMKDSSSHNISHQMEGQAKLARTGK